MARAKNPRRVVLGNLRTLNRMMRYWTSMFDQSSKVYTGNCHEPMRARKPDEYIENDPVLLRSFARDARDTAEALDAIARYAERRAHEVERKRNADRDTTRGGLPGRG